MKGDIVMAQSTKKERTMGLSQLRHTNQHDLLPQAVCLVVMLNNDGLHMFYHSGYELGLYHNVWPGANL